MAYWDYKGETGKAIDMAEGIEELGGERLRLHFRSLAPDTFEWEAYLPDAAGTDVPLPDLGQEFTLRRNFTRQFVGTCTDRKIVYDGRRARAKVKISGPWWWLQNIPLSDIVSDQTGSTADRSQFVFETGSPTDHLTALVNRAISVGAPIQLGSIATCFDIPRLSLRDMPFADAIAEIMRWVVDGVVFFDYSVSGHPALCMERRGVAATTTITPGTDVVPDISIGPRLDLVVEEITIASAERITANGGRRTRWNIQNAGTAATGLPRRQIATVSGPELDLWLPADFTDSVVVQSKSVEVASVIREELFSEIDPGLRATQAGLFQLGPKTVSLPAGATFDITGPEATLVLPDGEPVPAGFDYYLTKGEIRDWFDRAGVPAIEARLTATIYQSQTFSQFGDPPDEPLWAEAFGSKTHTLLNGVNSEKWWWTTVNIPLSLVKTEWTKDTTIIKPEDYAWINPPDNLAENLLATQNWLPWEGSISLQNKGDAPAGHPVGNKLNIANFRDETASMGALITGYSYSPATGSATYHLGPPARHAFRDLVNRFRASGADNIVFVSGQTPSEVPPPPESEGFIELPVGKNDLIHDSQAILYLGDPISWTVGAIRFDGDVLEYNGKVLQHN